MAITYTSEEEALYFLEDIFDRCQIPFILLDKVAKQVVENLDCDVKAKTIEVGVKKKHMTQSGFKALKMILSGRDVEYTDRFIKFEHKGTNVIIRIIKKNWAVLERPDTIFYRLTSFQVPNPFKKYWSFKQFIQ